MAGSAGAGDTVSAKTGGRGAGLMGARPGMGVARKGVSRGIAGDRQALGRYGEALAARYLTERGLEVVDRNWRCTQGELDLVMRDGDCLVFCEVKTRRSVRFGDPVEAVTWSKAARLRRLAAVWLASHEHHCARVRIDVIAILRPPQGHAQIRHLVGVGS